MKSNMKMVEEDGRIEKIELKKGQEEKMDMGKLILKRMNMKG